ncbi:MAG TPA: DNA repair protein RecN [Candidatus Atribacteria bacterium]|nr:DNA repair protein RecN [Candidatus Atribacteria bacterium]
MDEPKHQLANTYNKWLNVRKEISRIEGVNRDGVRRKDILLYQINEIKEARLQPGEEEELRKERTLMMHAEKIMHAANESYALLYTGKQGSSSVSDKLAEALSLIKAVENIDDSLDSIADQLENLQYTLEDVVIRLRDFKESFEYDPYRLEEIEERLQLIHNLKRKYGSSIEEILDFKAELESELSLIENSEERLAILKSQSDDLFSDLVKSCIVVSDIRKQKAMELEKELVDHLCDLNMDKTRFKVSIQTPDATDIDSMFSSVTENGFDKVEFLISPNPGEPLRPLAKIISGGEMSRVMLAFKTLLADIDEIPTMIFDEIDVGVSGRTAQKVAEKIGTISKVHQVICVTHLPQIASMADYHYLIEKTTKNNQTNTLVSILDTHGRQKEIARMIGGTEITQLSLEHAGELINNAEIFKSK